MRLGSLILVCRTMTASAEGRGRDWGLIIFGRNTPVWAAWEVFWRSEKAQGYPKGGWEGLGHLTGFLTTHLTIILVSSTKGGISQ